MQDYNHINKFLDKFIKLVSKGDLVLNEIVFVVKKNTNFDLTKDNFTFKNGMIKVNTSPLVKGEIMMKKEKILADLRNSLTGTNFLDIK
ncbi:MAG: hypothetical protein NTX85_00565 [Candidatus Nomurabacteria bacterium]|nr:hypothetical protein [Candidatus Nomurabacteria bacterium]